MSWLNIFRRRAQPAPAPTPTPPAPATAPLRQPTGQARGERNNNWGNIDWNSANNWLGQVGIEEPPRNGGRARFARFATPEHGIRALVRLLMTYQDRHNLRTIRGMIDRWAPPVENNTGAYVQFVAQRVGVDADAPVDLHDWSTMTKLAKAVVAKELGYLPADADAVIAAGLAMAGLRKD